jgi:hypothetical protein
MKNKYILSGIAAIAALVTTARAADHVIDITGATAFRTASIDSIIASYGAGLTDFAHTGTSAGIASLRGARQSIFLGTFPGLTGTTLIRCTWTGSVAGVRTQATPQTSQDFLPESVLTAAVPGAGGTGADATAIPGKTGAFGAPAGTEFVNADLAFSDSFPANSPFDVSNTVSTIVGITVFVPCVNEGSPAGLTNIHDHQLRTLYGTGNQPLSYLFPTTDTRRVYMSGRSDNSGTRTIYLSQTGYGPSNLVQQWKPTSNGASASAPTLALTTLQLWPTGDGNNVSNVWTATDTIGNGGFESSSSLRTVFGATSNGVQRKNGTGANLGAPVDLLMVGVFGISDATTAIANGAKALAYNGSSIVPAEPLAQASQDKVTSGEYTFWSYQHLMYNSLNDSPELQAVLAELVANVPTNIGTAGIDQLLMNVSRVDDFSDVTP